MKKGTIRLAVASAVPAAVAGMLLSGCFTLAQSDYPAVALTSAQPAGRRIAISGFEATYTTYTPVYGYSTVWGATPGYYRHGRYHGGYLYPQTMSTTTYVPETGITPAYAEKAQDAFESAGFVLGQTNAQYIVDVKFTGPIITDGNRMAEAATVLLSLLTADYTCETWTARLKITEVATGKVLLLKNYAQEYYATVWGPIPIFSPFSAEAAESSYAKSWSLSALTDRAVADATAFLSTCP